MLSKLQEHHYPETIPQILELLKNPNNIILAGGSAISLERNDQSTGLIDLQAAGLSYIKEEDHNFRIGAMTTAYDIYSHTNLPESLRTAAKKIGDVPLLHGITIGGNLAKLYLYVDLPPMLWALNAKIVVYDPDEKIMDADEFFDYSKKQNVYARRSLITEIILPKPRRLSFSNYQSLTMIHAEKAQLNLASYVEWDQENKVISARFVVSGSTSHITRISDLEEEIVGIDLTRTEFTPKMNFENLHFLKNYKSSIAYRHHILRVYIQRAIDECVLQMKEVNER